MFWRLTFRQLSAIDTLLNEEDCSLHDILDEDNVLQELKTQNKKLVDFFVRPDILEQLIKMVAKEPEENVEDKVKFKYPHLSCELLTCEVEAIVNALSESEHLMGLLWAFLDQQEHLNPLIGSFISKVLGMLLNLKTPVIFNYIRDREDFVSIFLNHLGTSAIMDLLLQMVAAPPPHPDNSNAESTQCRNDLACWFKEQGVVEKLVDLVHPEADSKQCANASQALCDMIRASREATQMASPTPLLGTLESEVTIKRLLDNMLQTDTISDVVIVSGVTVLLTVIERRQTSVVSPSLHSTFLAEEVSQTTSLVDVHQNNPQANREILGVILPTIKDFHNLLIKPPEVPPMLTTVGCLDPPLGNTRLQIVKLFCSLLWCNDTRVNQELASMKTFSTLLDLFFKFPWNNFLHSQVEGCISAAVSSAVKPNEDSSENNENNESVDTFSLKHHILHECQLVQRLLEGEEDNQRCCSEHKGQRQGYMGHLIKIVNKILQCGENDFKLAQMLKDAMEEDIQKRWNEFISGTVADTNRKNETTLGGYRPAVSSLEDSDDDFDQLVPPDNELDKAYQHFQEVKYTNNIVDDFGVDDELRLNEESYSGTFSQLMDIGCVVVAEEEQSQSAALFEAACNEKIQQFDDSESDEEESSTWTDKEGTFPSPLDRQSSVSSDEDENSSRQREFQTSFEDDEGTKSSQRSALYMTTSPSTLSQVTSKSGDESNKMEVGSPYACNYASKWQADISQEDLTGVTPMDTAAGLVDWTKESDGLDSNPHSNWADFSSFNNKTSSQNEDISHQTKQNTTSKGNNQVDILSPPKHDTSLYSALSPQKEEGQSEDNSSLNTDSVEFSVKDNLSSPKAPNSGCNRVDEESSSEEEANDSSSSEEDRSGKCEMNTSSDGEHLLQSPEQSPQQQHALNQKDIDETKSPLSVLKKHQISANGVVIPHTSKETEESELESERSHCPDVTPDEKVEMDETELSQNFDFLAQQGLLHGNSTTQKEQAVDIKRLEAMEACKQYDQTTQGSEKVIS